MRTETLTTETIRLRGGDVLSVSRLDGADGPLLYGLSRGFKEEGRVDLVLDVTIPPENVGELVDVLERMEGAG